jgi:hypothetical protein
MLSMNRISKVLNIRVSIFKKVNITKLDVVKNIELQFSCLSIFNINLGLKVFPVTQESSLQSPFVFNNRT